MNDIFESTSSQEQEEQRKQAEEIQKCIEAEIKEMEKYKWCLGVQLQHDPLQDRSLDEIYCEWIVKYAPAFRDFWEERRHEERQQIR